MSAHRKNQKWVVRYREGGRNRSRSFDRKADAERFDAEVKRVLAINPAYGDVYRISADLAARNYRFEEAVALSDLFLSEGHIVSQRGRNRAGREGEGARVSEQVRQRASA